LYILIFRFFDMRLVLRFFKRRWFSYTGYTASNKMKIWSWTVSRSEFERRRSWSISRYYPRICLA
jgi:hypothetical protein